MKVIFREDKFKVYQDLEQKKSSIRDDLEGCLNRIAITDDEEEVKNLTEFIKKYTEKYITTARECHYAYTEYAKERG